jgi:ribosome-associated protein
MLPDLTSECTFTTLRSSGPGGQHVNKTETKVELRFNVIGSHLLTDFQKNKIITKLADKLIENQTTISITCQESRSQLKNKTIGLKKLHEMLSALIKPEKPRIPTKPSQESKEKRIEQKKLSGQLKNLRGNLKNKDWDD